MGCGVYDVGRSPSAQVSGDGVNEQSVALGRTQLAISVRRRSRVIMGVMRMHKTSCACSGKGWAGWAGCVPADMEDRDQGRRMCDIEARRGSLVQVRTYIESPVVDEDCRWSFDGFGHCRPRRYRRRCPAMPQEPARKAMTSRTADELVNMSKTVLQAIGGAHDCQCRPSSGV